jgi:hypothetical protein
MSRTGTLDAVHLSGLLQLLSHDQVKEILCVLFLWKTRQFELKNPAASCRECSA